MLLSGETESGSAEEQPDKGYPGLGGELTDEPCGKQPAGLFSCPLAGEIIVQRRVTSEQPARVMLRLAGGLRLYATLAAVLDVLEGRSPSPARACFSASLRS